MGKAKKWDGGSDRIEDRRWKMEDRIEAAAMTVTVIVDVTAEYNTVREVTL